MNEQNSLWQQESTVACACAGLGFEQLHAEMCKILHARASAAKSHGQARTCKPGASCAVAQQSLEIPASSCKYRYRALPVNVYTVQLYRNHVIDSLVLAILGYMPLKTKWATIYPRATYLLSICFRKRSFGPPLPELRSEG